jgi:excisionase family DNA binding protein
VQVRLKRRGRRKGRECYLYVRLQAAERRLSSPSIWRRAVRRPTRANPRHRPSLLDVSRDIYWTTEVPPQDLKAQILLALIQLGCVPLKSGELRNFLASYVCETYRIPIPVERCPSSERAQARRAIAILSASNMITNWAFPEDYRAFRSYIPEVVRRVLKEYLGLGPQETRWRHGEDCDRDEERLAGLQWVPSEDDTTLDEEGRSAWNSFLSFVRPAARGDLKSEVTVREAAEALNLPPTYIHRLIRQGRLHPIPGGNSIRLSESEMDRVRAVLVRRDELRAKRRDLQKKGLTREAARKDVYRRFGGVPKI